MSGQVVPGRSQAAPAHQGKAAAIEAQIAQTRQNIEATLSALRAKLSPAEALHRARDIAKRHPLEIALVTVILLTAVVWHVAVHGPARRPRRR